MSVTYKISTTTESTALVEFENDQGCVYTRNVNIPSYISGNLSHPDFLKILEDHKRSVEYRSSIGLISFQPKNIVT
jgi:hypothetical protein